MNRSLKWFGILRVDRFFGDLKKLIAAQTGTRWEKIVLKKWYTIYKDHIKLEDCNTAFFAIIDPVVNSKFLLDEIHDGMNLELYYQ